MKKTYDFSDAVRNPYAKRLKRALTIRLDIDTVDYFQKLAGQMAMPYQTLINMYLRDCSMMQRRPQWIPPAVRARRQRPRKSSKGASLTGSGRAART
jgi:BrnA antitoxin of type II toxin-antitoxin system